MWRFAERDPASRDFGLGIPACPLHGELVVREGPQDPLPVISAQRRALGVVEPEFLEEYVAQASGKRFGERRADGSRARSDDVLPL
jgi:hypothetical protein